jgi:hypothetical protein
MPNRICILTITLRVMLFWFKLVVEDWIPVKPVLKGVKDAAFFHYPSNRLNKLSLQFYKLLFSLISKDLHLFWFLGTMASRRLSKLFYLHTFLFLIWFEHMCHHYLNPSLRCFFPTRITQLLQVKSWKKVSHSFIL